MYQHQYLSCDIVLASCKMLPLGETVKLTQNFSILFLKTVSAEAAAKLHVQLHTLSHQCWRSDTNFCFSLLSHHVWVISLTVYIRPQLARDSGMWCPRPPAPGYREIVEESREEGQYINIIYNYIYRYICTYSHMY